AADDPIDASHTWSEDGRGPALAQGERGTPNPPPENSLMDNLRWWLLLLVGILFSMSGCASSQDWEYWRSHPTHFASGGHMGFSVKNDNPYYPMVTEADAKQAQAYGWWGDQVPLVPPTDLSGR